MLLITNSLDINKFSKRNLIFGGGTLVLITFAILSISSIDNVTAQNVTGVDPLLQNNTIPGVTNVTYYQDYDYYGQPVYYDDNGDYCHKDDNNGCYYDDNNGDTYYKDDNGDTYYKDENNNYYYVDVHGHHYWYDNSGNKFYYSDNDHSTQFHYTNNGDKVIHTGSNYVEHQKPTHYVDNHPGDNRSHKISGDRGDRSGDRR